jgi:hypothetical protein
MHLYKFVYYKSLFDFKNYDYMARYNNYYLSGLHNHRTKCPVVRREEEKEEKKVEDVGFDKITLPDFQYPMLHKYYNTYKNNFFDLFKEHNEKTSINNGSFFDLFKRHIENKNESDVNGIFNSFDELKFTHAKNDNSFI